MQMTPGISPRSNKRTLLSQGVQPPLVDDPTISQVAAELESLHLVEDIVTIHDVLIAGPSLQKSPSISQVATELGSLHLEEDVTIPGTSLPEPSIINSRLQSDQTLPSESTLKSLEMLITATTLTSTPMDTSYHGKLFTSSSEFYHHQGSTVPDSLQSLDVSSAIQGLEAVSSAKKPSFLPAYRPSCQFGWRQTPIHLQRSNSRSPLPPRSPSPTVTGGRVGKVEHQQKGVKPMMT
ncbi:hypothetical protein BT96DRAFT_996053 [Gymnopus androsaceus JB14]|uniref:Uncharacterized protein n=1 Tax=Gymnopus androsaceus JB14 TaxID=1447944 RepID=A0A6A4HGU6_9AGAR|nr:hypothetical protein BT96DRAFT_996053 [Gymnopus androsaceus JB14]